MDPNSWFLHIKRIWQLQSNCTWLYTWYIVSILSCQVVNTTYLEISKRVINKVEDLNPWGLHVWSKIGIFREKNGFDDYFDLTECLQQIEISDLLHLCAPCSQLSSNISTLWFCSLIKKSLNLSKKNSNPNCSWTLTAVMRFVVVNSRCLTVPYFAQRTIYTAWNTGYIRIRTHCSVFCSGNCTAWNTGYIQMEHYPTELDKQEQHKRMIKVNSEQ